MQILYSLYKLDTIKEFCLTILNVEFEVRYKCYPLLRSVGVVLYVLLSGVSPFLDESQEETCSNIVRNDFCFPDEYFAGISPEAKELVRFMLVEEVG